MSTQLVWDPAVGAPITIATDANDFFLTNLDGTGPVAASALTSKGPGQPGSSALDIVVSERIVVAQAMLLGADLAGLWALRSTLATAMAQEPLGASGTLTLGLLTLKRGSSLPDLEIPALPHSVGLAIPSASGIGLGAADLEWLCPYPFWRATSDTTVTISAPATPTSVANSGDALTPALIRIYGDMTLVRVTNLTTGEAFELAGQIPSGQYVEIDTTPGNKQVNLVNGSVLTNWMNQLNVAVDDLFQLQAGANSLQFTAGATGGSGARDVVVIYRPRTRGV